MPADFTLPPDTRTVGSGNPPADMDALIDAVTAMGATYNVLNSAYAGGADPTGVADSTAAIQAAVNTLGATGGVVYFPAGQYKTTTTITCTTRFVTFRGAGITATRWYYYGTGDCLRIYDTDLTGRPDFGSVEGLMIDGGNSTAPATALHYGDMRGGQFNFGIETFNGAGDIGLHLDNQNAWTEECRGYVWMSDVTNGVVFDVSGATTSTQSFGYSEFYFEILSKINQNAIVLQNGALVYHSTIKAKINNQGSGSAQSSAVLTITGQIPAGHPAAGTYAAIQSSRLEIQAELGAGAGAGPNTIVFGTAGSNAITSCYGIMDFTSGGAVYSNAVNALGSFAFDGICLGDSKLWRSHTGVNNFNAGNTLSNGQAILPYSEIYTLAPTTSLTGMIISRWTTAMGLPSRFTVVNSGPGSVTFDVVATSHVANGAQCTIQPNTSMSFTWDNVTGFWYPDALPIDITASDIQPDGLTAAAGGVGLAADAGHIHPGFYGGMFGNGSDGALVFDGTTTILGIVPGGSTYTMSGLARDIQASSITINVGVTVKFGGWRVFCKGAFINNGTISQPGNAGAATGAAGGAGNTGTLGGGLGGGAGTTGAGAAPAGAGFVGSGAGGAGGLGASGAGGAGGTTVSASTAAFTAVYAVLSGGTTYFSSAGNSIKGGPGGGGGGGDGTNAGGGGGGGGGVFACIAWSFVNAGTIAMQGGAGGSTTLGNTGGGGGGSGGLILVYTLAAWTAGTTNVTGGAGGGKTGTGVAGSNGNAGSVLNVVLS